MILANVLYDLYHHLYKRPEPNEGMNSTLKRSPLWWVTAVMESSFIRMFSELGRLHGMLARGDYAYLGLWFDWFAGTYGDGPGSEEQTNAIQRILIAVLILSLILG